MNRQIFMSELYNSLYFLPESERRDITEDYEEHFREGIKNGKTEEQICRELGNPREIANSYRKTPQNHEKRFGPAAVIMTIIIILLNITFILGIYLGIWGIVAGLFSGSIALFIGGVASIIGFTIIPFIQISLQNFPYVALVFLGIGSMSLSILWFIGNCYLVKFLILGTKAYVNWNIKIIESFKED